MYLAIINDCADGNAAGRQAVRAACLFGTTPVFVPVASTLVRAAHLEASGNLVDLLDAAGEGEGVILVNVAPRAGDERHWDNGTPFCHFIVHNTLVCASVSGDTLALPRQFGLIGESVEIFDIARIAASMVEAGYSTTETATRLTSTQFRSLEFLPLAAHFLKRGGVLPTEHYVLPTYASPPRVWALDSFGNAKTTLTDVSGASSFSTRFGTLPVFDSLKDVPDGTAALVRGSSGYGNVRFYEVIIQGASAAARFGIALGDTLVS